MLMFGLNSFAFQFLTSAHLSFVGSLISPKVAFTYFSAFQKSHSLAKILLVRVMIDLEVEAQRE